MAGICLEYDELERLADNIAKRVFVLGEALGKGCINGYNTKTGESLSIYPFQDGGVRYVPQNGQ